MERNTDRTVRDLQAQIERRDRQNLQLADDFEKSRDKIERLLKTIEDLQQEDSKHELEKRRAERELRTEREERLRLEREIEGWRALRLERGLTVEGGRRVSMRKTSGMSNLGVNGGQEGVRRVSSGKGFL